MNNQKAIRNLFTFGAFASRLRLALTLGILLAAACGLVMFRAQAAAGSASIFNPGKLLFSGNTVADTQSDKRPASPLAAVTTNGGSGLAASYPDLASAIIALNGATITSPVVITASGTETAPAGGYSITAQGTSANTIIIDGGGATTITAGVGTSTTTDGIFKLIGADFVTLQGFTLQESAGNTTTTTQVEWGIALLYATTTNGSQNNTIQNNTITLNRTNVNTFGIYANATHTATAPSTSATATGTAGGNTGLKVYGNNISNVNLGIIVVGPTAVADVNNGIDIGGTTVAQGNTITNFGTSGTFSTYANVSGTVNGILVRNSINANISFNTITSSVGGVTAGTLNGIQIPAASNTPTATFTTTVNNNNISLQSAVAAGTMVGITQPSGSASTTSSFTANNNNFATFGHTVAATGAITFITSASTHLNNTINSNTFTGMSVNTTGTVTFISNSVTVPAGGSQTINGNSIVTSFTRTSAGTVTGITTGGSSTTVTSNWNNNNFSNITVTGASAITFINNTDGGSVNHNITGNTFSNITGGTSAIIGINSSFGGANGGNGNLVSNNTISNISSAGAITGIQIGSSGTSSTVTGNTVNTLASSGASLVVGITSAAPTSNSIFKNKVYDLSGSNASGTVSGIAVTGGTLHTVFNNLIGDLRTPAANAANPLIGLNITGGTTINASFNTIFLNGSSSGALFGSSATSVSTTPTVTLRNNIFVNNSAVAGAGVAVAYRRSSSTLTTYGSTSNNNDFFASTIYTDGTTPQATITAYKTLVSPRDSSSFAENPPFLSTSGASAMFLHINPATPTQLESGGVTVSGITDDFDGDTRNATTPDIGADEFAGTLLDLVAPTINYTAFLNTSGTANRTLTVTITDPSGVAGGALAPRIYFRKSTDGSYVSTQCTGSSPTYTCTIDYTLVGGGSVTTGDIIQYFVVAQDTAGNVGANPSGGFAATDVNNVTSPPTTPSTYTIVAAISGSFNVGAGETYTSLTNTGGIFEFINNSEVAGNITINITSDLSASSGTMVAETGTVALNQFVSPHTITIKPSGAARSIVGTTASNALIRLNGASRVTIDGSLSGGTDRSLTIENTSTTTPQVVRFGSIGTTPIVNDTLRNCTIRNGVNTSSAIVVVDTAGSAAGYFNNITIQNNDVQKAFVGVFTNAIVATGNGSGLLITQNKLDNTGANAIRNTGLYVQGADGATVSNNTVGNLDATNDENDTGIWLASGAVNSTVSGNTVTTINYSGTSAFAPFGIRDSAGATASANNISGNTVSALSTSGSTAIFGIENSSGGTTIQRNNVQGVTNNNTNTFGAYGINISAGNNVILRNNFVSDVKFNMSGGAAFSTQFGVFGIRIAAGTGHQIYHNSVNMFGALPGTANSSLLTAALGVVAITSTGMDIRNNVLANNITGGTTSIAHVAAYLPSSGTSAMNLTWNNNAYYYGTDTVRQGPGQAGTTAGTNFFTTFDPAATTPATNLRSYTSTLSSAGTNDNASQGATTAPPFVSNTDLHLTVPNSLLGAGAAIGSVTVDYDNDPRPASAPDMGADEVVQAQSGSIPAGTYYNALAGSGDTLGGNVTVTNNLTLNGIASTGSNTLTLDCNATVSGAGSSNYVVGNLAKIYCAAGSFSFPVGATMGAFAAPEGVTGYSPATVNFTSLTTLPSTVTVKANVGRIAGTTAATAINRYWDLTNTATAGTYLADLGFTYVPGFDDAGYTGPTPLNRIIRYENNSGVFTNFPANETGGGNPLTVNGISAFSQWGIGGNANAPTLATVKNHEGYRFNDGNLVRWQSSFEQDNLGFRVYRQDNGARREITPNLIAGSALMTGKTPLASGKSYSWWDANGAPGSIYYVEDLDLNGKTTLHGPIMLGAGGNRADIGSSQMLNELRPAGNGTGLIEQQVLPRELRQSNGNRPEPGSDSFAMQLALAGRPAVKLGVRQNGWYRVSGAQLQAAGLPSGVDAGFLQLYVNGVQVPLAVRAGAGGVLGAEGVIEFYGVAGDTRESDTATYWLIAGDTPGLRIGAPVRVAPVGGDTEGGSAGGNAKSQMPNGSFAYTVERKERSIYVPAIHNGDTENFFGAIVSNAAGNQTLRVSKPVANAPEQASLSVALQGATEGAHQVAVSFNGAQIGVMSFNGQERKVSRFSVPAAALREGDNAVTLQSLNGSGDVSVTDYLRLTYQHRYEADDNRLLLATGNRSGARITGFTANNVRVFDLTEAGRYFEVAARTEADGDGYAVTVPGHLSGRQLLAIADSQALSPASIVANEPSSWTRLENTADFIILAPRAFRDAANSLAAFRRQQQGLRTVVVTLEDVFDEWNGGAKDVNALRGFLRYAKEKWSVGPQYVLFMGDASIDPRNYLGFGDTDLLPTAYVDTADMETSSDETLVDFDGDGVGEMSIGRWPARTLQQAQTLVYRATVAQPATGNRRAVLVADQTEGYNFEQMNQDARALLPSDMPVTAINRNGQPDATVRSQIISAFNEGPALVQYAGHGSQEVWTGASIFNGGDAGSLTNGANRLPLFVTMTCLNGYFHTVGMDSLAESLMKAPNGGALAVWASSSLTFPEDQAPMNRAFIQAVYSGSGMRLGDAARQAKSATGSQTVRRTWILFGDPTARMR